MVNSLISFLEFRVVVGFDFGIMYFGFVFVYVMDLEKIYVYFDYFKVIGEKYYCKIVMVCYYKKRVDGVGGWKFKLWGYFVCVEYEKDIFIVCRYCLSDLNEDLL